MRFSLKNKFIVVNLTLMLMLALLCILLTYSTYSRTQTDVLIAGYEAASQEAVKNINQYFSNVESRFKFCFYNENFRSEVMSYSDTGNYVNYNNIQKSFDNYFDTVIPVRDISFEDLNGNHYRSSQYVLTPEHKDAIKKRLHGADTLWLMGGDIAPSLNNLIIMAKRVDYTDASYRLHQLGYAFIAISESMLVSQVNSYDDLAPTSLYFYDHVRDKLLFFPTDPLVDELFLKDLWANGKSYDIFMSNNIRYYISLHDLKFGNYSIVYTGEINRVLEERLSFLWIAAIIMLVSTFVVILLSVAINNHLASPVKEIISVIGSISRGDFHRKANIKTHDEFADIGSSLNMMSDKIHELSRQIVKVQSDLYERKLEWKDLEISVLNTQISSHFFYNILTAMRGMIAKGRNEDATVLISQVVTYLRYATNNDKIDSLFDELQYIRNYVSMHRLRTDETPSLIIECPSSLDDFLMYKFLLQPLIENALVHAFPEGASNCKVIVRVRSAGDGIKILIYDNGCGFDANVLSSTKSIGLSNVYKRLDLYYSGHARLRIRGMPGKGTLATLTLPLLLR